MVGDVSFTGRPLLSCLGEPALQRAQIHIPFVMGPRNTTNPVFWPYDVTAKNATSRDYLNLMVANYETMTWHIDAAGGIGFYQTEDQAKKTRKRFDAGSPPPVWPTPSAGETR